VIQPKKDSKRPTKLKKGQVNVPADVFAPDTTPKHGKDDGHEIANNNSRWQSGLQVGHKI
jgi:hypothetical protein